MYRDIGHWRLLSAVDRNAKYPAFVIPSYGDRASLQQGVLAQLLFEIDLYAPDSGAWESEVERMWVCVQATTDTGYVGVLINQPRSLPEAPDIYLVYGAEIVFSQASIVAIWTERREEMLELDVMGAPTRRWRELAT